MTLRVMLYALNGDQFGADLQASELPEYVQCHHELRTKVFRAIRRGQNLYQEVETGSVHGLRLIKKGPVA
jgi:hypothetical protein